MKKQFFFLTTVLFAAVVSSYAQMKPGSQNAIAVSEHNAKAAVHPAILANFETQYPGAGADSWATIKNGYLVNFSSNNIAYTVFLDKKGQMTSQVRYYPEKDLPAAVRDRVKETAGCSTIGLTKEVTTKKGTAYLVTVSDESSWKVIRVSGDEAEIFEEHKKG